MTHDQKETGMKRKALRSVAVVSSLALPLGLLAACSGGTDNGEDGEQVTIEFAQWWGTELPDGTFQELIDGFEAENPDIKVEVISEPFANVKDQLVAGAASGTMSDVVGLDGNWVYDFVQQGALADMSEYYEVTDFDPSNFLPQEVDGGVYRIPAANFTFPLFVNEEILAEAGVEEIPETRAEFEEAASKISELGGDVSALALPLSLQSPNSVKNDILSWLYASGGRLFTEDGEPNLTSPELVELVEFMADLSSKGYLAAGAENMQETDKVEEFRNGRAGTAVSSLAHINLLAEGSDLDFTVAALPKADGFDGTSGVTYASWGLGIAESSEHKEEAWKLVDYILSTDVNEKLAELAYAFPGNSEASPDFVGEDERTKAAYEAWMSGEPVDEFIGLPSSDELMRTLLEGVQRAVSGSEDAATAMAGAQKEWEELLADS
ncbi:MAG: sugar ABC transporter substrate-binding protein [Microbacterium sp.]